MEFVQSGEIAPGVLYQVTGTSDITYDGVTYSPGEWFVGIDGVTDFTGTGKVTYGSEFLGGSVGFTVPALYYSPSNLFTDQSYFKGQSVGVNTLPSGNYNIFEGYSISVLRFTNKRNTLLENRYFYSKPIAALYARKDTLIPFQFIVTASNQQAIRGLIFENVETGEQIDRSSEINKITMSELTSNVFNIIYNATDGFSDIPFGTYRIVVQMLNVEYTSELITVVPDYYFTEKKDLVTLEWWNDTDWELDNGTIIYDSENYAHKVHLIGNLIKPDYKSESEEVDVQGNEFFIEQYTEKQHNLPVMVTEPVLDAIRLMPLHDHAQITSRGVTYDMKNIQFEFEWENIDLAALSIKFETGQIFKKI